MVSWRKAGRVGGLAALLCAPAAAQAPLVGSSGAVHVVNTDLAVLDAQEVRTDLPCSVLPEKPVLGFDLRFHAGFDVSIPLQELAGGENQLTILFRVTTDNRKDDPYYFVEHIKVPQLDDDAKGNTVLQGTIDVGEGGYHVDWLMRDRAERVCSADWDMQAALAPKDKQIELSIAPGLVEGAQVEQFREEPPVARSQTGKPLGVKVLVNFAPQNFDASTLRPLDTVALVSILRRISREPQFGRFSVVAFNIQQQRILYRQKSADKIDFPALGDAIHSLKLGTVDLKRLSQKHSETEFLAELIKKEMTSGDHPDALIFAGPKIMLDEAVPQETLKPFVTDIDYPVFYMNYNLNPQSAPWRDAISRAVKVFKGTEYTITRPRDLWFAVSEMVASIVKSKGGGSSSLVSTQ